MTDDLPPATGGAKRWIVSLTVVLFVVFMASSVAFLKQRDRLEPYEAAAPAAAAPVQPGDFRDYERTHTSRDEARVAEGSAAYDAWVAAEKRSAEAPVLRKLPDAPIR